MVVSILVSPFNKSFSQCLSFVNCVNIIIHDFYFFFSNLCLHQYFWGITSTCCILSLFPYYFLDQFFSIKFPPINHSSVYLTDVRLHDKLHKWVFTSFLFDNHQHNCFGIQFSYSNIGLINSSVPISWKRSMSNSIS